MSCIVGLEGVLKIIKTESHVLKVPLNAIYING
jgi:hypothetical protein